MAGVDKEEFAPLLAPGRHMMTMEALARLCVAPFDTSATRGQLLSSLNGLVQTLSEAGIACHLWIDGSFVSAKINPDDIDLSLVIDGEVFDSLPADIQDEIDAIAAGQPLKPDLHVYPIVTRPMGHPGYSIAQASFMDWSEFWSVARGGWLKGLPVIRLGETDVGLRILP